MVTPRGQGIPGMDNVAITRPVIAIYLISRKSLREEIFLRRFSPRKSSPRTFS